MSITYGKTTPTAYTDPEVVQINRGMSRFGQAMRPGAYLVDTYPILKYVPGYLTELKKWHQEELALFQGQLNVVRELMANRFFIHLTAEADFEPGERRCKALFRKVFAREPGGV